MAYESLIFYKKDYAWLDFVAKCRNGEDEHKNYDFIIGSIANDDVFTTIDLYMRGIWDSDRALSKIKYYKTNHKICLVNQLLIDVELKFNKTYEVKRHGY